MPDSEAYLPIQDYAIVGDCGGAALVSRLGSVDWLCWPRFDSPSLFAALLDARKGGRFQIRPTGAFRTERRYVSETNVLETTFTTETGCLRLSDCMTLTEGYTLQPDHELLRVVACDEGYVDVDLRFEPRPDYGRVRPRIDDRGALGYFCNLGGQVFVLRSEVPLVRSDDRSILSARFRLQEGDRRAVSLVFDLDGPAVLPPLGASALERLRETEAYWREWAARCTYQGPYRDAVLRSALTLKLLTYARSGAIVAAPTTSLPEDIGGVRNWDYRYCWVRDAALTLRALFELGYAEEGQAFFTWLLFAIGGSQPTLNVLYDVYGRTRVRETRLDHLEGYLGSRPVRIGNDARKQLQLDIYGEVVSAAFEFVKREGEMSRAQRRLLCRMGEDVCKRWQEPDEGIWEVRSGRSQHTYSKVMCWVALDRLLKLHEDGQLDVPVERFRRVRAAIRDAVERHGYSERLGSYVAVFDSERLDASLLLLPLYGFVPHDDPRMRGTYQAVQRVLGHDSLLYRYPPGRDDGLPGREGAFGICSFWSEQYLARCGRVEAARRDFEATLAYANDLGLFSEEIDPETGALLGNFPQAFTHVGLINAALSIAEAEGERGPSGLEQSVEEHHRMHPRAAPGARPRVDAH